MKGISGKVNGHSRTPEDGGAKLHVAQGLNSAYAVWAGGQEDVSGRIEHSGVSWTNKSYHG
eukprot:scaffold429_cov22-Tisochrysis_lutea.AAC.2